MRKHHVTFFSPGTFYPEQSSAPVSSLDTREAAELARGIVERYGARPFAFRFCTMLTVEPVSDGEGGFLDVLPRQVEQSGLYFLGGTLRTIEEVIAAADPGERILLGNMRQERCPLIIEVRNSYLSTHFFGQADAIVDPETGEVMRHGADADLMAYRVRWAGK